MKASKMLFLENHQISGSHRHSYLVHRTEFAQSFFSPLLTLMWELLSFVEHDGTLRSSTEMRWAFGNFFLSTINIYGKSDSRFLDDVAQVNVKYRRAIDTSLPFSIAQCGFSLFSPQNMKKTFNITAMKNIPQLPARDDGRWQYFWLAEHESFILFCC